MGIRNTGWKIYQRLEQYLVSNNQSTGVTKPNIPTDPDYVEPVIDLNSCPIPSDEIQDLTKIQVEILNSTTQFINCEIVVKLRDSNFPLVNEKYIKGPSQSLLTGEHIQSRNFVTINIATLTSSLNLSSFLEVYWIRGGSEELLYKTNVFNFNGEEVKIEDLFIESNPLGEKNKLKLVFKDAEITTTTTTSTTTTTTSTTTTTTEDPYTRFILFVDPSCLENSQIQGVDFVDAENIVLFSFPDIISISSGVVSKRILKGVYNIVLKVTKGGNSLLLNGFEEMTQSCVDFDESKGVNRNYFFPNVNINQSTSITLSSQEIKEKTVFARIEIKNRRVKTNVVLPYGKEEIHYADIEAVFYEDEQCITRAKYNSRLIRTKAIYFDNIGKEDFIEFDNIAVEEESSSCYIADREAEKQWDYTLNDPNQEDSDDLIVDSSYRYELLDGFRYIVVN